MREIRSDEASVHSISSCQCIASGTASILGSACGSGDGGKQNRLTADIKYFSVRIGTRPPGFPSPIGGPRVMTEDDGSRNVKRAATGFWTQESRLALSFNV